MPILEEIQRSWLQRQRVSCADVRHGHSASVMAARRKRNAYLPQVATGDLRMQAFGVTEPTSGTDTSSDDAPSPARDGDVYVVSGQKIWTSRAEHSDLMLLLARTTAKDQVAKRSDGLSVFIVDMREALGKGV